MTSCQLPALPAAPSQAGGGRVLRYLLLTVQAQSFHQQHWGAHTSVM